MIADPNKLSEKIMESWVRDFYSWDICDQCIMNYFEKHELAWKKAILVAEKIKLIENKHAQWVAGDALRELTSDSVKKRLYKK